MTYLGDQKEHWETGYFAPNVESFVFRFYGRILSKDFGIDGRKGERILDFGCGQGAAVNYFHRLGFSAFGVDISETDIEAGRQQFPQVAANLAVIDPTPDPDRILCGGNFDCVIAVQSLYYFNDEDMATALDNLAANMRSGGVYCASMISPRHTLFDFSQDEGNGLRLVDYNNSRIGKKKVHINFTKSEQHLLERFSMFEPVHVGFYSEKYRSDEGERHHFTFVGTKP